MTHTLNLNIHHRLWNLKLFMIYALKIIYTHYSWYMYLKLYETIRVPLLELIVHNIGRYPQSAISTSIRYPPAIRYLVPCSHQRYFRRRSVYILSDDSQDPSFHKWSISVFCNAGLFFVGKLQSSWIYIIKYIKSSHCAFGCNMRIIFFSRSHKRHVFCIKWEKVLSTM
jgi:hypothetical protein